MPIHRLSSHEISTDLPLEVAREACWRALVKQKFSGVLIDRDKNVVAGSRGSGFSSRDETALISFANDAQNTTISVKSQSIVGGKIDFGRARRRAKKVADALEVALASPQPVVSPVEVTPQIVAPIAAPTGESSYLSSSPVYGTVMPVKRGTLILIYALLGLTVIHILSPIAWIYANRTLADYGALDPGDKKMVRIGRIIGIVGTVILLAIWGFYLWAATQSS